MIDMGMVDFTDFFSMKDHEVMGFIDQFNLSFNLGSVVQNLVLASENEQNENRLAYLAKAYIFLSRELSQECTDREERRNNQ